MKLKTHSQNIRILLPDGNPRGIRKVERSSNSNIRLFQVPRRELEQFYGMDEAANMGIYFLVGGTRLYIGKTGNLCTQMKQHDKEKPFWQHAFIVILNNDFRTDHLYCLEKMAIETAQKAHRFALENGTAGNTYQHLHDSILSDCHNIFDEIDTLLAVLNQDFFAELEEQMIEMPSEKFPEAQIDTKLEDRVKIDKLSEDIQVEFDPQVRTLSDSQTANKPSENFQENHAASLRTQLIEHLMSAKQPENHDLFYFQEASGFYNSDNKKFTLSKGSLLAKVHMDYTPKNWYKKKNEWLATGKIVDFDSEHFQLVENIEFSSTSTAAGMVAGSNWNGWKAWKNKKGKTLHEVFRKKS